MPGRPTALARFIAKTRILPGANPCIEWTGHVGSTGYGKICVDGRTTYAHRYAHETFIGPIPAGHHVDHLCSNRRCVNPFHLEAVTPYINSFRATGETWGLQRGHCAQGHLLTPATAWYQHGNGWKCKACHRLIANRSYAKRRAEKQILV